MDTGSVDKKIDCLPKKIECGQKKLSVLSVSVSVDCGLWTVDCWPWQCCIWGTPGANKGSSRNSSQKRPKAGDRISSENLDNGVRNRYNRLRPPTIQGIDQSDKALGKHKAPPLHLEPTSKKTKSEKKGLRISHLATQLNSPLTLSYLYAYPPLLPSPYL